MKVIVITIPLFEGSDELKKFIMENIEADRKGEGYSEYPLDNIEDLDLSDFPKEEVEGIQEELKSLAKDIKDNDVDYIRIEHR